MKHTIALIATTAVAVLAASAPKAPQWEPIAPDALAHFARDTTRAHQIDSVARVQAQAAQVIRQNALQNLGEDIHYTQGDSVDLQRGLVKRFKAAAPAEGK